MNVFFDLAVPLLGIYPRDKVKMQKCIHRGETLPAPKMSIDWD